MSFPIRVTPFIAMLVATLSLAQSVDPAFEKLVPRTSVDRALTTLDPKLLIELTEKIAAAEKALKRTYPIPLGGVLKTTLRAASLKRDTDVLDRVIQLAKSLGNDDLVLVATLARSNSRAPKSAEEQFTVALDQMPADEVARIRGWMNQIYTASAMENREGLLQLEDRLKAMKEIDPRVVTHLTQRIDKAVASLPEQSDIEVKLVAEARKSVKDDPASGGPKSKKGKSKEKDEPKDDDEPKPNGKQTPPKNFAEAIALLSEDPDAVLDEAFEGKIDLAKLGKYYKNQDAMGLTDMAIRMTQEEQILDRKHRFIPSEMIFKAATAIAMLKDDEKALARIEKQMKAKGENSEEFTRFASAKLLRNPSRKANKPLMVTLDSLTDDSTPVAHWSVTRIDEAIRSSDRSTLQALQIGLTESTAVTAEQRNALHERIAEGLAKLPATPDEGLELLRVLGEATARAESRLPVLNSTLLSFASANVNKSVGHGKSETFLREALKASKARLPATEADEWGSKISVDELLPGDLVRFSAESGKGFEFGIVFEVLPDGKQVAIYTSFVPRGSTTAKVSLSFLNATTAKELTAFRAWNADRTIKHLKP